MGRPGLFGQRLQHHAHPSLSLEQPRRRGRGNPVVRDPQRSPEHLPVRSEAAQLVVLDVQRHRQRQIRDVVLGVGREDQDRVVGVRAGTRRGHDSRREVDSHAVDPSDRLRQSRVLPPSRGGPRPGPAGLRPTGTSQGPPVSTGCRISSSATCFSALLGCLTADRRARPGGHPP
uniref:Uncharacterized protein n=1 Tax=Streptomyces sp. F12 TaxID=1436084 RepID=V9ZAM8_9ACTN|nr:hypothetical protein pFRL6_404c [Streptomyces sp. F12]